MSTRRPIRSFTTAPSTPRSRASRPLSTLLRHGCDEATQRVRAVLEHRPHTLRPFRLGTGTSGRATGDVRRVELIHRQVARLADRGAVELRCMHAGNGASGCQVITAVPVAKLFVVFDVALDTHHVGVWR